MRQEGEIWGQFTALRVTEEEVSDLEKELLRLNQTSDYRIGFTSGKLNKVPFNIRMPSGEIISGFVNMDLTVHEKNTLAQSAGIGIKQYLAEQIETPEYQNLNNDQRVRFIKRAVDAARDEARNIGRQFIFNYRWQRLSNEEKENFIQRWRQAGDVDKVFPILSALKE